jgi:hypothetical protein
MYGPNYDLNLPLDRAIAEWVWELDQLVLAEGRLPPETFFGVFRPAGMGGDRQVEERQTKMRRDISAITRALATANHSDSLPSWPQKLRRRLGAEWRARVSNRL